MRVVKLGGSLLTHPFLPLWLNQLSELSKDQRIIVVPGGGPFADEVRQIQEKYSITDSAAHHMAILAMSQFGILLTSLVENCRPFFYPEDTLKSETGLFVWLPSHQIAEIEEIEHSWDVTSDTLALWLAQTLNADELNIIKSCNNLPDSLMTLSSEGIIDKAFNAQFNKQPIKLTMYSAEQYTQFPQHGIHI